MKFNKHKFDGVITIEHEPQGDSRGFFMRAYDDNIFRAEGISCNWVQENHAMTVAVGVLRGLHFQLPPYTETKLIRCIAGEILDVFVDLRTGSATFGMWDQVNLSNKNQLSLLLPRGFAHGYLTLTPNSEVLYKVDNYYNPDFERGILWSDTKLNIVWPVKTPILSEKDMKNMTFKDFCKLHISL